MKKLKKLKINKILKDELCSAELYSLRGGGDNCNCCCTGGYGTNITYDNAKDNVGSYDSVLGGYISCQCNCASDSCCDSASEGAVNE